MNRKWILVATVTMLMTAQSSIAGGSSQIVSVKNLSKFNETEFVLVVSPLPGQNEYGDPFMAECQVFTVLGAFKKPWARLTKEGHLAALALLADARRNDTPINLGWVGTGFVAIDEEEPCVVRSRALEILKGINDEKHVVSYHK